MCFALPFLAENHHDVCSRLVSLLCVQHVSKAFGDIKRLMCRRKLQRLRRHACKISGHQVGGTQKQTLGTENEALGDTK